MITVVSHIYNEEKIIKFFINSYRKNFPNCYFIFYNHMSTDHTTDIIKEYAQHNFEIIDFNTNGKIVHSKYLYIKNNAWKKAKTNFVCVVDADEIIDINENQLKKETEANIIKFNGFNMVNMENTLNNINDIKYGVREKNYDKLYLFNKKYIKEINYSNGAHTANPEPFKNEKIKYSKNIYNAYHYHFIDVNYCIDRYNERAVKLSKESIDNKLGVHYLKNEQQIKNRFNELRSKAVKII